MMDERDDDAGGGGDPGSGSGGGGKSAAAGGRKDSGGANGVGIRLPRHDFVSKLVKDPANVSDDDGLVLLNGWAGDSDEEGYTRLYCEPTLETYADVKDEDILHYEDDPKVGYRVWAKKGAQVRHGRRGQPKGEAGSFFQGQLLTDYRGGGGGGGDAAITLHTVGCPIGQTGWHYCSILTCPPVPITAHICSIICPTQPVICGILPPSVGCPEQGGGAGAQALAATDIRHCGVLPPSIGCPPQGGGAGAEAAAPAGGQQGTAATLCTQIGCPHPTIWTQLSHCTIGFPCGPGPVRTFGLGCPRTSDCPPTHTPGCGPQGAAAQNTAATLCTQIGCDPTAATHCFICPPRTADCPVAAAEAAAPAGGAQSTAATVCTQIGCGHDQITIINPTLATRCFICPPITYNCPPQGTVAGPHTFAPGCTLGFTCTSIGCNQPTSGFGCPNTSTCPPHTLAPGCTVGFTCTAIGCHQPTSGFGCPNTSTCPPHTLAPGCTVGFTCTAIGCPPQGGTVAGATFQPACTLGFTCTSIGCR